MSLRVKLIIKQHPWPNHQGYLEKILLASQDIVLEEVVMKLKEFYGDKIIAMQLKIGTRNERWTNPTIAEIYSRMVEARAKAAQSNGNETRRRFWQKLEKLHGLEIGGLPFDVLEGELKHFEKAIPLRV